MKYLFQLLTCVSFLSFMPTQQSLAQELVEITGQVVNADGQEPLFGIIVEVVGKDRGVVTNNKGMFSIVIDKQDQLKFHAMGFKDGYYKVPNSLTGKYHTFTKALEMDTFHLEDVTFTLMTPEEFDFAFKYGYVPDPSVIALQNNYNPQIQSMLVTSLYQNHTEHQKLMQMQNVLKYGKEYGQPYMGELGNPRKWREFVDAWKRGDFRSKGRK